MMMTKLGLDLVRFFVLTWEKVMSMSIEDSFLLSF